MVSSCGTSRTSPAASRAISPLKPPELPAFLADAGERVGLDLSALNSYHLYYYLTLPVLILTSCCCGTWSSPGSGGPGWPCGRTSWPPTCMGLNPARLKLAAFALGAGLAGLAGSLYAIVSTTHGRAGRLRLQPRRSIDPVLPHPRRARNGRGAAILGVFLLFGFDRSWRRSWTADQAQLRSAGLGRLEVAPVLAVETARVRAGADPDDAVPAGGADPPASPRASGKCDSRPGRGRASPDLGGSAVWPSWPSKT